MSDEAVTPSVGPRRLLARLASFSRRPDIGGMATVVAVKAGLVILNFALITLAAWTLDADAFGHYSILFSAAGLLYIVAAGGQEPFVLRSWNEMAAANDGALLKGALRFTIAVSLIGSVLVTIGFVPWAATIVDQSAAVTAVIYLVIASSLQICMHLVRTEIGVAAGDGAGNAIVGIPPIVYLGYCLAAGIPATTANVFLSLAIGAGVALVLQIYLIRGRVYRLFPDFRRLKARYDYALWLPRSGKLWVATSLEATNQYIDVIIIGYLMDPVIAGAYFVTVRLANLFAAAADSINLFATRHLPGLYYRGEKAALERMLDSLAWITLAFIIIGMLGIVSGGYFALLIINAPYTQYFPELLILCLGTAALATTRSSTITLMLTGHEGRYLLITALSVVIRVVGLVVLVPRFGVMGAVCATAASFVVQAFALRQASTSLTGIDSSMFRLLKTHPGQSETI